MKGRHRGTPFGVRAPVTAKTAFSVRNARFASHCRRRTTRNIRSTSRNRTGITNACNTMSSTAPTAGRTPPESMHRQRRGRRADPRCDQCGTQEDERDAKAQQSPEQQMAANHRVTKLSVEHPVPGDQRVGPEFTDVGFDRQVEQQDLHALDQLHTQVVRPDRPEQADRRGRSHDRSEFPEREVHQHETPRAAKIAAAHPDVPARQQARHDHQAQARERRHRGPGHLPWRWCNGIPGAVGPPRRNHVEPHRPAGEGGGFDAKVPPSPTPDERRWREGV